MCTCYICSGSPINHVRGSGNTQWRHSAGGLSLWMPGLQPQCTLTSSSFSNFILLFSCPWNLSFFLSVCSLQLFPMPNCSCRTTYTLFFSTRWWSLKYSKRPTSTNLSANTDAFKVSAVFSNLVSLTQVSSSHLRLSVTLRITQKNDDVFVPAACGRSLWG